MKNGGSNMNIKINSRFSMEDNNIKPECSGYLTKYVLAKLQTFERFKALTTL